MSSDDSDSDVCDFMTDTGTKLGKDKFWNKFKLKADDVENVETNDYRTRSKETDPEPMDLVAESQENVVPENSIVLEDVECPTTKSPTVKIKVDDCTSINIGNRLETLAKKAKEIFAASSKPARGGRRGRGRGRGRAKQIALPYTRLITALPPVENDQIGVPSTRSPNRAKRRTRSQKPTITEVVLSSDDEASNEVILNKPSGELNPVVSVKVLWKSVSTHTFQIKKFQTFEVIKDFYVKEKQANPKLLYFTHNNTEIDLDGNNVVSLRLKDGDVIEGSTLSENYLEGRPDICLPEMGHLKLKVQFNARRSNTFCVSCRETDKMEIIFWQVMQEVEEPIEKVKLYFDGELLNPSQEIAALDLEEGDCFDLIVSQP